jgi:hypothetical protein
MDAVMIAAADWEVFVPPRKLNNSATSPQTRQFILDILPRKGKASQTRTTPTAAVPGRYSIGAECLGSARMGEESLKIALHISEELLVKPLWSGGRIRPLTPGAGLDLQMFV